MGRQQRDPAKDRVPYHEQVATKLIEQLEAGTAPWQKPWEPGSLSLPHNPVSGTKYRGANAMWLQMQGRADPRWLTYRQAHSVGAQVRRGEKGTLVQYWKFRDQIPVKNDRGQPVKDADGNQVYRFVELDKPKVFSSTVFNAAQIDGLPPLAPVEIKWDRHERAEAILKASGADIRHDQVDRAYYTVGRDRIHLPGRDAFPTADGYYAAALHEFGHWTGHPSRLDRDLAHPFGSEGYAKEELRAEIASLMIGDQLGIGHDPGNHAAYVKSWIKVLGEDPREILRAARDADKIADYVMAFEKVRATAKPAEPEAPTVTPVPAPARPASGDDAPGPHGPLDPAALAARLTRPQAADLSHLAEVHAKTVGSYDYPRGRSERLRTGKRLESLGLVENAGSSANGYSHWRITELGIAVAEHLPAPEKPAAPTVETASGTAAPKRYLMELRTDEALAAQRMAERIDDLTYNVGLLFDDPQDRFKAARQFTRANRVALLSDGAGITPDDALWLTNRMHDRTPRVGLAKAEVRALADAIPGAAALLELKDRPAPTFGAKDPDQDPDQNPGHRLKAAVAARDLKGALDVLRPLPLRQARDAAHQAGFKVPESGTKADLYRALQPQLLQPPKPPAPADRPLAASRPGTERAPEGR